MCALQPSSSSKSKVQVCGANLQYFEGQTPALRAGGAAPLHRASDRGGDGFGSEGPDGRPRHITLKARSSLGMGLTLSRRLGVPLLLIRCNGYGRPLKASTHLTNL